MKVQNYSNHSRKAPSSYYSGILLAFLAMVFSLIYARDLVGSLGGVLLHMLFVAISIGLILVGYYARMFALKAQDRAIRAEENLRHFVLTGKLLDSRLRIRQIIALRFASDEEFVDLAKRAVAENLSNKQIKEAIVNWRPDYYRV